MNTMTGKEVLRAIADGADPSEFEWRDEMAAKEWRHFHPQWYGLQDLICTHAEFRRKPRTRVVNGFTVPAPIQEMPTTDTGRLFYVHLGYPDWCFETGFSPSNEHDQNYFVRGLLFSTKEAAIANAKAMCGINPESEA